MSDPAATVPAETFDDTPPADERGSSVRDTGEWAWELSDFGRDVLQVLNAVFDSLPSGCARVEAADGLATTG
jgi:hypothetical protein